MNLYRQIQLAVNALARAGYRFGAVYRSARMSKATRLTKTGKHGLKILSRRKINLLKFEYKLIVLNKI